MISSKNEKYLKKYYPNVWSAMNLFDKEGTKDKTSPVITKTGLPSLLIEREGQLAHLHSKYDPIKEAEQWLQQYEGQLSQFNHIFFYGIGFGYHVELLMHKYPDKWFTLYEPNPNIFYEYLCHRNLNDLPLSNLKALYVEHKLVNVEHLLTEMLDQFSEQFLVVTQPIYERIFQQQTTQFFTLLKNLINRRTREVIFLSETKSLWSVNCMENFKKVLETPNIIREMKSFFQNKPVLMVAAGPSLHEDIDSIRLIKKQGLAYIFAVGSANKALISYDIYPDAICTYDPFEENFQVFEMVIKGDIAEIPLIFGTSVEHKTVTFYPGPLLHMITSRDPIVKYYLEDENFLERNEIVSDEPSIALLTMNLLHKLGCELIILAGQNFAYKNEQFYSKGIEHQYLTNQVLERLKQDSVYVESVDGDQIMSWNEFNVQRLGMEKFISNQPNLTVINTTKGGAKIAGTQFMEIEQVIAEIICQSIVTKDWYKVKKTNYNIQNLLKHTVVIGKDCEQFSKLLSNILKTLSQMENFLGSNNNQRLNKSNIQLVDLINELTSNKFYSTIIKSELHLENESLNNNLNNIRLLNNFRKKITMMIQLYFVYFNECRRVYDLRVEHFLHFQEYIFSYIKQQESSIS